MKVLVGAFNKEKAVVGAFTVNVKTGCETDGWSASLVCIPGHQDAWVGAGPSCVSSPHVQAPHQPHGIGTEDRNIEPIHTITILFGGLLQSLIYLLLQGEQFQSEYSRWKHERPKDFFQHKFLNVQSRLCCSMILYSYNI